MYINRIFYSAAWKYLGVAFLFLLYLGVFSFQVGGASFFQVQSLQAQVGVDFNQGRSSGTVNLGMGIRAFQNMGDIVTNSQKSILLGIHNLIWFSPSLSTRIILEGGLPLSRSDDTGGSLELDGVYTYTGELSMRFSLYRTETSILVLGPLLAVEQGHTGSLFLGSSSKSLYLQTTLAAELEMAFAFGLEYLFFFRLNLPISNFNVLEGETEWAFYPRQGALTLAFLFHKGPSFRLSKAPRLIYYGPFYKIDAKVFSFSGPRLILSHTIGLTYYIKPPF